MSYNENEPTGTGNDRNTNQSQNSLTYGASVNWQILRWLAASLQYTYTKQTGTNTFSNNQGQFGGGDYSENRGTLNLFATFLSSPRVFPRSSFKLSRSRWIFHTQRLHRAKAV